jgi:hypothetical protein
MGHLDGRVHGLVDTHSLSAACVDSDQDEPLDGCLCLGLVGAQIPALPLWGLPLLVAILIGLTLRVMRRGGVKSSLTSLGWPPLYRVRGVVPLRVEL